MSKKKYEAGKKYEETATKYDARYSSIQQQKFREVFSQTKIKSSDLLLDVGAGTGLLLDFLPSNVQNIISCDISFNMLLEGKNKLKNALFVCADSEHLPFRESCLNIVTCFSVIQNLQEPTITVSESFRVLKIGGKLLLTVLDKIYCDKKLEEIIVQAGYEIEKLWHLSIEDFSVIAKKD